MKKIICFVMVTCLLAGFTPSTFALSDVSEVSDVSNAKGTVHSDDEIPLLKYLGIINEYNPEEKLSTEKMLSIAVKLGNVEIDGANIPIADIQSDNFYYKDIQKALAIGLIELDSTGKLNPNLVTFDDAIKTVINAIGNKKYAEAKGGDSFAYLSTAQELGILSGINLAVTDNVKISDYLKMVYNALFSKTLNMTGANTRYNSFNWSSKLFIEKTYNLRKNEGILVDNGLSTLYGLSKIPKNHVKIDNTVYLNDTEGMGDYLGYKLRYYIHIDENEDMSNVVLFTPVSNEIFSINAEDIYSFNRNYIEVFDEKGKSTKYSISKADVIYNKIADNTFLFDFASVPSDAKFTLVDNNKDGNIDVIYIKSVDYYFVSGADFRNGIITDEITGKTIALYTTDNVEKYVKINDQNASKFFDGAYMDKVLEVYKSKKIDDICYMNIYVKDAYIEGKITSMETDNANKSIVVINDKTYFIKNWVNVNIGDQDRFYLNSSNEIVYRKNDNVGRNYGLITDLFAKKGLSSEGSVKIYTVKGEWFTYELADFVEVTDETGKHKCNETVTVDKLEKLLLKKSFLVVRYTINGGNKITKLATEGATEGQVNPFVQPAPQSEFHYTSFDRTLGANGSANSLYLPKNTPIMFVPTFELNEEIDESMFKIGDSYSYFSRVDWPQMSHMRIYDVTGLNVPELILIKQDVLSGVVTDECNSILVTKISTVSENDAQWDKVTGLNSGNPISFVLPAGTLNELEVQKGDVIRASSTSFKWAAGAKIDFKLSDARKHKIVEAKTSNDFFHISGVIEKIANNYYLFSKGDGKTGILNGTVKYISPTTPVVIYDLETNQTTVGNASVVNVGDYVYMRNFRESIPLLVVYR